MINNSRSFSVPCNTLNSHSGFSGGVFATKSFLHAIETKRNNVIEYRKIRQIGISESPTED